MIIIIVNPGKALAADILDLVTGRTASELANLTHESEAIRQQAETLENKATQP